MPDAPAGEVVTPPPAAEGTPPPQTAEEMLELALEEGKPPVKVPVSKVNPHLDKLRREADKRMSEADRLQKEHAARASKLEAVLKAAKEDTDGALRELGIDPDDYAEKKIAARVQKALREAEEKADPAKKGAREADEERERLRAENEKLKKGEQERTRQEGMQKLRNYIEAVKGKLPEPLRDAAQSVVIGLIRAANAEGKDLKVEDAAKAARSVLIARAKAAYEADEELRTALGIKPPAPKPAETPHPAATPAPRQPNGKFAKTSMENGAGDVLLQITSGKF